MKIVRVKTATAALLDPSNSVWNGIAGRDFPLTPTPLNGNAEIKRISPFLEKSTDHGAIGKLAAAGAHNGEVIALRLSWACQRHDAIVDLDEFVDGVAVMFPLSVGASAITMGSKGEPVNAWYWKADLDGVGFDVVAEGYGTSARRAGKDSKVGVGSAYDAGVRHVVLSRALDIGTRHVRFSPGRPTKLAFAVWDGGNRERAGRKSFSGDFVTAELEA